jgi:phosphohistidine phosphatase
VKELILVRHAKSSWRDTSLDDHSRPLNKRGKRDAPEMGARLARRGCDPDLLISSTAVRAIETARTIARKLGYPRERILEEERLYHASVNGLIGVISNVDDSVETLMLFGHNPGFTQLANMLGPRDLFNMPTCAVLHLRFDTTSWNAIGQVAGEDAIGQVAGEDAMGQGAGEEILYDFPKNSSA